MLKATVAQDLTQSTRLALASALSPHAECLEATQHVFIFAALSIKRKRQDVTSARYVLNDRSVMDPLQEKGDSWR